MNRTLSVAAGVLLTAAVTALIFAWREIDSLRSELAALQRERAAQNPPPRPPAPKKSPLPAKPNAAEPATVASAGVKEDTKEDAKEKEGGDWLMGAGAKEIKDRSDARVVLLAERLKLRPDQVETLKKRGAERVDAILPAFERVKNGNARPPDLGIMIDWFSGRFDLPVNDLLDADQAELFAGFDIDDRTSRVENLVSMELMELHGEGGISLSAEQKDAVFTRLSEIIAEEDASGDSYYADDGQFSARIAESLRRRQDALRSILTAAQMQNYERILTADGALIAEKFPSTTEPPGGNSNPPP